MRLAMLKCWAMIIVAAVVVGLSISQCVDGWRPCCNMAWIKWCVHLACGAIGVAYIIKYSLMLKRLNEE